LNYEHFYNIKPKYIKEDTAIQFAPKHGYPYENMMYEYSLKDSIPFLQKLKVGDILVMTSIKKDKVGKIIKWGTGGNFTHVAIYVGEGYIIESIWDGVRRVHWSQSGYPGNYHVIALRHHNSEQLELSKVVAFVHSKIGLKYDYPFIIFAGIAFLLSRIGINARRFRNFFDLKNSFICTELVGDAYFETIQVRLIKKEINRSQYEPNDFVKNSEVLEQVAEYYPEQNK